jgi:hypothetical protein
MLKQYAAEDLANRNPMDVGNPRKVIFPRTSCFGDLY